MATTAAFCLTTTPIGEPVCRRQYLPTVWGSFFLTYQPCTPEEVQSMEERALAKKTEVGRMLQEVAASSNLARKLGLVDELERLGVDYHYKTEINDLLGAIYNGKDDDNGGSDDDLYITSLKFYLLRKHGYALSSDVFLKFRDEQGNISSDDVKCLIMLYDASHLRIHEEKILDNINSFTKSCLQSVLETNLEPALQEEVRCTLETPRFRRVERIEAKRFISAYEKNIARDDALLEFARLDYNIVQILYCKELKELTVWWKEFHSRTNLTFARDRIVEMYFWVMAIIYEPCYSYSRIWVTKMFLSVALLDDIYDNYTSTEESNIFTTAMERWDVKATEQLPANMRTFYDYLICTTDEVVEELKLQNNKNAELVKKVLIDAAKCYHSEVKWRDDHYVPNDVGEHLQLSMRSIAAMHSINFVFISLGAVCTREAVECAFTYPKIIRGICVHARISNDIASHEREQASEHMASTLQTCMKQYGITVEEAAEKLRVINEESWMDIVEECLYKDQYPLALSERVVAFAQSICFMYNGVDKYTIPSKLKDSLDSLYVNLIPV
nr:zizaene synthase [synthetic construct]